MTTRWYSIDINLQTVDHEAVTIEPAFAVIDDYFSRLRPHHEYGEEALAETMFGFIREDGSYMQICLHAPDMIDVEYDFDRDERLTSRDAVRARVRLFFTLSPEQLRQSITRAPD